MRQDAEKTHDRMFSKRIQQPATGGGHPASAETDAFRVATLPDQFADEVAAVQIAAWFTGTQEDAHGVPAPEKAPKSNCGAYVPQFTGPGQADPARRRKPVLTNGSGKHIS
jgi:hypothetical protein